MSTGEHAVNRERRTIIEVSGLQFFQMVQDLADGWADSDHRKTCLGDTWRHADVGATHLAGCNVVLGTIG